MGIIQMVSLVGTLLSFERLERKGLFDYCYTYFNN
jgi:hypothetical protein